MGGAWSIHIEGLDEIVQNMEKLASPAERERADAKALSRIGKRAKEVMRTHIPESQDNGKSGRALKGGGACRPRHGHARDNIPIGKLKREGSTVGATVGWKLSDNSEYFYMKFVNWGTSKMPPSAFLEKTLWECEPAFVEITKEEYIKLLKELGVYDG